jgi:hypothetical protein
VHGILRTCVAQSIAGRASTRVRTLALQDARRRTRARASPPKRNTANPLRLRDSSRSATTKLAGQPSRWWVG